jgi:osmotically-inducible protein OsmY
MRRPNGWLALSLAGFVAIAASACDNTAAGAKKDAEIAAEQAREAGDKAAAETADAARDAADATKRAGEKAAEATEAATEDAAAATAAAATTTSVKSALMADRRVDATRIDVDTNGASKVVTLKGSVPTAAQKTTAETIARDKAEGYTVVNQLVVS